MISLQSRCTAHFLFQPSHDRMISYCQNAILLCKHRLMNNETKRNEATAQYLLLFKKKKGKKKKNIHPYKPGIHVSKVQLELFQALKG